MFAFPDTFTVIVSGESDSIITLPDVIITISESPIEMILRGIYLDAVNPL